MSRMEEVEDVGSIEFKWLKKKGVGGKKKEIQFYESFMYDGIEYALYDCVYMNREGLPEPFIGKLIKIWEHSGKTKKVKVQWFFRVWEISKWLGDNKTLENEIFLASGEGFGLANVNPLEAIAGKCNVVCISKDSRNPQPSDEELKIADYVFYRTFDVQSCTISDKMEDKVGGLEIKYIYNRKESENVGSVPKLNLDRKEDKNTAVSDEKLQLLTENLPEKSKTLEVLENGNQSMVKLDVKRQSIARNLEDTSMESLPVVKSTSGAGVGLSEVAATTADNGKTARCKADSHKDDVELSKVPANQVERPLARNLKDTSRESLPVVKSTSGAGVGLSEVAATTADNGKSARCKDDSHKDDVKLNKVPVNQVERPLARNLKDTSRESLPVVKPASGAGVSLSEVATMSAEKEKPARSKADSHKDDVKLSKVLVDRNERHKSAKGSDALEDRPSKKRLMKSPEDRQMICEEKLPLHDNDLKALVTTVTSEEKAKNKNTKDSLGPDKAIISARDSGDLGGRPTKKARIDGSLKLSGDKNRNSVQKLSTSNNGNNAKNLVATVTSFEEKPKSGLALNSLSMKKGPKNEQTDEKRVKPSNGKLLKLSSPKTADEDKETTYKEFEVTGKPDAEKSNWFKQRPWEERIRNAYEQGTLVLLRNLDPEYTSDEVEAIIWHAFKESCAARMIQRTALSSPQCGQALAIFKTKGIAGSVIRRLDEECLMLSNGRPIVGSSCPPPSFSGNESTFFGHLVIDKIKMQNQREMKEAVSTSHYSQANTVEFEMAMEWCLLQSRADIWWKKLYKQQEEELKKPAVNLKRK